ncbi:MAG TPA: respiratory nitrate reductase subunit gamma, partial [Pirellulales bacterium]|nr:respiratory nitrate reductase subunit gamma [Pirellulales bacterium]
MSDSQATREVLWNIRHVWVMYALLVPTLAVAGYGIYRRARSWRRGGPDMRFDRPLARVARLARYAILQSGVWRQAYAGTLHAMIFWGFIILTIATTVVMIDYDFGIPIMQGKFYLYFQSLIVDVFGALAIVGIAMAGARRWIARPPQLVYTIEASALLLVILAILVSGFLVEGWRIAATEDPWGAWSPMGYLVAAASRPLMSIDTMRSAHAITWWTHLALVFGLLAWAPYTKLIHVVTSTVNVYTSRLAPIGANLRQIDFEHAEKLGIN